MLKPRPKGKKGRTTEELGGKDPEGKRKCKGPEEPKEPTVLVKQKAGQCGQNSVERK